MEGDVPHYYFDSYDGETVTRDQCGITLPDKQAARDIAVETLPEMAQDHLKGKDHSQMAVHVVDENDNAVLEAKLHVEVNWD